MRSAYLAPPRLARLALQQVCLLLVPARTLLLDKIVHLRQFVLRLIHQGWPLQRKFHLVAR